MYLFKLLMIVLSFIPTISGFRNSMNCTFSCRCKTIRDYQQSLEVRCNQGFWTRIPDIPEHTKTLKVKGSDMGVLQGPPKCVNYEELNSLEIRENKITAISNSAFRCFYNLTLLDIGKNRLSMLNPNTLIPLHSLHKLTLDHNQLTEIQTNTSADLRRLQWLIIGNNPLIAGSYKWISNLKSMRQLNIMNNNLSEVPQLPKHVRFVILERNQIRNLKNCSFCDLPKLNQISLGSAHVEEIEAMAFSNLPKLNILNLEHNRIYGRHLKNLFSSLSNSTLQVLVLDSNPIKSLNKTIYDGFNPNVLKTLSLKDCQIKNIDSETFTSLSTLEKLDLSSNNLNILKRNTFKGLHSLKMLDLGKNRLNNFVGEVNGIQGSPLRELNLKNNDIRAFFSDTLWGLQHVNVLNLRNNDMTRIKKRLFQNMSSLSVLIMKDCRLTSIQDGTFSNLLNMTHLDLSGNRLTLRHLGLDANNFQHLTKLKKLDLSNTLVGKSSSMQLQTIWQNTKNLTVLVLNNCQIPQLYPGMFSSLGHLKKLILNSNDIPFIEPTAFKNCNELEELYINQNDINSVNWMSFLYLPNLKKLSLHGNNLVCSCEILWIAQAIKSHRINILQQDNLYCAPPGRHQQRIKLNINVYDCEEPWETILKPIATALGCVGLIVIMYFIRHYQWHIRYTFFLAKAGIHRYREMQDEQQYEYDAFVAYHSDDLPWVEHLFLHNVDREYLNDKGYSLCIHHRDWLAGEYIADNIRKSIVESRKTIIVLSKAFATSHWCRFELEMARANTDAGGRGDSQLVVILLESIPEELLNPHLVHILTTKTYILWPKDPALQPRFWKAVRKALKKEMLYKDISL